MNRFLSIPAALLMAASLATAGEGLAVGPEATLIADGPGKGIAGEPAVAFGNDLYLVAWREGWHGKGGTSRILAARLDRSGKVLDAKGIEVASDASGVQDRPKVAFASGVFLVVWQELKDDKQYDIRAARVSPEGKVLDAKSIAVAAAPENDGMPEVASDGQSFVVVWQGAASEGGNTEFSVFAASVSAAGAVGAPAKLFPGGVPQIAWDGKSFMVFGKGFVGMQLDASGKPVDTKAKTLWSNINRSELTYSMAGLPSGGWLITMDRSQPDYWGWGGPGAMRCYALDKDGKVDAGIPREESPQNRMPNWLDIGKEKNEGAGWPCGASATACDGKRFVVVWQRHHIEKSVMFKNCDLIASRVDGFKPLDEAGVPVASSDCEEKNPALASDGAGGLLCAYERYGQDGKVAICARTLQTR